MHTCVPACLRVKAGPETTPPSVVCLNQPPGHSTGGDQTKDQGINLWPRWQQPLPKGVTPYAPHHSPESETQLTPYATQETT